MNDRKQYDEINAVIQRMMRNFGGAAFAMPEFKAAWKALEKIKNKHGGMPPKKL